MTNYAKKHPYILTTLFIGILAIIMLILGFRIQPNLSVSKNGNLQVTFPMASTTLYVDNKKIDNQGTEGETVTTSLSVKTHTVIISRLGYFPWAKEVKINPNETTILKPIFVTQNTTGQIITKNDKDYWALRNKVQISTLPTEANPRTSGDVSVWATGNTVFVKDEANGNSSVKTVVTPVDTIRSLDFYADRTDVIIFATDNGVYALEAIENAANNKANFFPIYKGSSPIFLKTDPSFLYVLDGENLLQVVI